MKIQSLKINGIGGIKKLDLTFSGGLNVICGTNGIGKSTILDIITYAFNLNTNSKLKRNASSDFGEFSIDIIINENGDLEKEISKTFRVESFAPNQNNRQTGWYKFSRNLMYFGIERSINYNSLKFLNADPEREDSKNSELAITGIKSEDIKSWFINRYLFEGKKESLTQAQIENLNLSKEIFSLIDNDVKFKTVTSSTLDIMLTTSKGEIYFEYLSDGYKSCIYIILGIIKEIEYRTKDNIVNAKNFDGVVLIDEIDLHLHPKWQAELVKALRTIFPNVQFILTTHSPSILQSLQKEEIIALGIDDNGNTYLKELNLGEYGLQGWTLEEILKYVMDMPSTTSSLYERTLHEFDEAMNREDKDLILQTYKILKKMLRPDNPLSKLLSIQVAEWED